MRDTQVAKRLFARVLVWQPASGTILDLPSRAVHSSGSITKDESRVTIATGSSRATSRTHNAQIPVTRNEHQAISKVLRRTDCPVKAAFIGVEDTESYMWLEPTRINLASPEADSGYAYTSLVLENSIFHPAIWRGEDLLRGVPWQGTKDWKDPRDGSISMRPEGNVRRGYEGPLWLIAASSTQDRTVDLRGESSGLTETAPAISRFEFPAWGARVRLKAPSGYVVNQGEIRALDFNGSLMDTASGGENATLSIPREAWYLEVKIVDTEARPRLRVLHPGDSSARVYAGAVTPDCSRVSDPGYEDLPDPNEPPEWKEREDLLWGKNNTAPTFTKCEDYSVEEPETGGGNKPQVFQCDDYFVTPQNSGPPPPTGYTPPSTIQPTSAIYTADGGFAKIDWPGLSATNIKDNVSDGEVAVDENAGYVFVATDNGINRYDLSGGSETTNIAGTDPDGVAVDQLTQTLYFTEAGQTGIWTSNYSGSSTSKLADPPGRSNSIAVAPDAGNGGFIFVASFDAQEIYRLDLSGSNKKLIADYSNRSGTTYSNVHLHLDEALVFWQQAANNTTRSILRAKFNGQNESTVFVESPPATNVFNDFEWTILQDEKKWVEVRPREGGKTNVEKRNLDGSGFATDTILSVDSGLRIASAQKMSN